MPPMLEYLDSVVSGHSHGSVAPSNSPVLRALSDSVCTVYRIRRLCTMVSPIPSDDTWYECGAIMNFAAQPQVLVFG